MDNSFDLALIARFAYFRRFSAGLFALSISYGNYKWLRSLPCKWCVVQQKVCVPFQETPPLLYLIEVEKRMGKWL